MTYFQIILFSLIAFALFIIAYPETRLGLKELIKKHPFLTGSLTCFVLVIITFLYFPLFFKLVAIDFWKIPLTVYSDGAVEVVELADLGSIGDIFGSLNSFISSIALCAVAFSTWLQVTSLSETRDVNRKQLDIAEKSHQEQMKESRHAIFSNALFALLNVKENKFNSLEVIVEDKILKGHDIFLKLAFEFNKLIKNQWKDEKVPSKEEIEEQFRRILNSKDDEYMDIICSYFLIYGSMYRLVNSTNFLSEEENYYYKQLISDTMRIQEQITLCYLSCYISRYQEFLKDSYMFGQFYTSEMSFLVKKYHHPSHFLGSDWIDHF